MNSNLTVRSVSFSGKHRFLSQTAQQNLREVLGKMNKETVYTEQGDIFESKILKAVKIKNSGRIFDNRTLVKPVSNSIQGQTSVEFSKAKLEIDNVTGEIINYQKPFWVRLKKIQKEAETLLEIANKNFNNPKRVTKQNLTVSGLTQQGVNKLDKIVNNALNLWNSI